MRLLAAWRRLNLWPRLVIAVTGGFLLLFAVFTLLALRAVEDSTDRIQEERLVIAKMAARDIDRLLERGFYELERARQFAPFDPTAPSLAAEVHMLNHAYGRVGTLSLGVHFLDARGRVVLSQPPGRLPRGADLSQTPYIKQALVTRRRTVSPPFRDPSTGASAVALTRPLLNRDGTVRSLLVGLLNVAGADVVKPLDHAKDLGHTGHAELVDERGLIVASTSYGGFLRPGEHLEFYRHMLQVGGAGVENVPYTPWHAVPKSREGERHVMAFAPLAAAPWGVAVGGSERETFAPVARLRNMLLLAGALTLAFLWGVTLIGARLLVRPVRTLTEAAGGMASGDLERPVRISEGGEIGALAASLETMRAQLRDSLEKVTRWGEELEAQVQKRTAELRASNRRLAAVTAVATAANEARETEALFGRCLDVVLDFTGADAGAIRLLDERSRRLGPPLVRGDRTAFPCRDDGIAAADCPCGVVAAEEKPLYLDAAALAAFSPPCRAHDGRALAILPLQTRGRTLGVLSLSAARADALRAEEQRTLRAIVDEIAVAIENARLFDELRRVEGQREAQRVKAELISAVSHELRTPLGFIRSYATTLLSDDIDPIDPATRQTFVRIIDEEAGKLQQMIDDLLDASRFQSGHLSLETELVVLDALVENAVGRAQPVLEETGHALSTFHRDGELRVVVDPLRIEQVLRNLLDNAARYSEPDTRVELVVYRETDEAVVSVTDRGDGILEDEREAIFEPFFRGESSRRRRVRGTGLGLAICRAIVEAQGGPALGREHARARQHVPLLAPARRRHRVSAGAGALMAGEHILVVDDEPRYLQIIRFNLEARRYRVTCAATGEHALALLAGSEPDLVVLDVMLPGLDGFEVCRRIREVSTTPIIILTAKGADEEKVRGLGLGADDYVTKPFSAQELVARVGAVLRRARPAPPPPGQSRLTVGDLEIDLLAQQVTVRGRDVRLSPTEYRVLACLAMSMGAVLARDELLERVWGPTYRGDYHILRVTLWRLRQKLEESASDPRYIVTRSGVGYMLAAPGS